MEGAIVVDPTRTSVASNLSETSSITSQSQTSDISLPLSQATNSPTEAKHFPSLFTGDINTAAALRAQYAIETPKSARRRHRKPVSRTDKEEEPVLVDNTAILPLHSKKTERLQRKQQKRSAKLADQQSNTTSLLSLPSELLTDIFAYLLPADIASLLLTNRYLNSLVDHNESVIARSIIRRRYWVLHRCFPLPIAFSSVPADAHAALLSPKRQEMLNIHRKSYHQHIQMVDPHEICTCMTCVFAWNNLCLIIDLHHWQSHLENREPLPIIPRGTSPEWNQGLLERNARLVRQAMVRPIVYARILQMHLSTITGTILRNSRWRRRATNANGAHTSGKTVLVGTTTVAAALNPISTQKPRLYRLTDADVERGTDGYLERSGPPSYDFPFQRDIYYSLEAYLPNRKWSSESNSWGYYALPPIPHERDLEWVRNWVAGTWRRADNKK